MPTGAQAFKREVRRKAFHLLGFAYLAAYHFLGRSMTLRLMLPWMAFVAVAETARLRSKAVHAFLQRVFGGIVREKEARRYTGLFYVSLGVLVLLAFFGRHPAIVSASIAYLVLGDAASAVVGLGWGRHSYRVLGERRSAEGTAAGFAVALAAGAAAGLGAPAAVAGAVAFLVVDNVPAPPDDNFWIPVACGAVLWLCGVRGG